MSQTPPRRPPSLQGQQEEEEEKTPSKYQQCPLCGVSGFPDA